MLLERLKNEYELRYRIMRYTKFHKWYLYNVIEKNNYNIIVKTAEDILVNKAKIL